MYPLSRGELSYRAVIYAIIEELKDARLQFDVEILLICYSANNLPSDVKDVVKQLNEFIHELIQANNEALAA